MTWRWRYAPELAIYNGATAAITDMLDPATRSAPGPQTSYWRGERDQGCFKALGVCWWDLGAPLPDSLLGGSASGRRAPAPASGELQKSGSVIGGVLTTGNVAGGHEPLSELRGGLFGDREMRREVCSRCVPLGDTREREAVQRGHVMKTGDADALLHRIDQSGGEPQGGHRGDPAIVSHGQAS